MTKRIPIRIQTNHHQGLAPMLERGQAAPPLDLDTLTPSQRVRLDAAVMTLVEYLVSASTKTE